MDYVFLPPRWLDTHVDESVFPFGFSDNVEDHLGHAKFLLLLGGSHFAGIFIHAAFDPNWYVPCVGASAGIAGVLAYYAFAFPHAKIGLLVRAYWRVGWLRVSSWVCLVAYFAIQLIGVKNQIAGFAYTSYLGHLSGLTVGSIAGAFGRFRERDVAAGGMQTRREGAEM